MEPNKIMELLTETNDVRIAEADSRPRVEMLFDDYAAWVAYHRAKDRGCEVTPHLGVGWN